jgi:hypothetical protein
VYAGTKLRDKQTFGEEDYLVGYECDGALCIKEDDDNYSPTHRDGTPRDFQVLGCCDVSTFDWSLGAQFATMGVREGGGGGIVFTAATTNWARTLEKNEEVARITMNVLKKLA